MKNDKRTEKLYEAMTRLDPELLNEHFALRARLEADAPAPAAPRVRSVRRIIAISAAAVLILAGAVAAIAVSNRTPDQPNISVPLALFSSAADSTEPEQSGENSVSNTNVSDVTETGYIIDRAPVFNGDNSFGEYYGKSCTAGLLEELQKSKETDNTVVVCIKTNYISDDCLNFLYNGKTITEYYNAAKSVSRRTSKMRYLLYNGNNLAQVINNLKSADEEEQQRIRETYGEQLDYIGEDLLNEYIVDGVFLKDQLESDLNNVSASASDELQEAKRAYNHYAVEQAITYLESNSIIHQKIAFRYYTEDNESGKQQYEEYVFFSASVKLFEGLSFDKTERFVFAFYNGGDVPLPEDL